MLARHTECASRMMPAPRCEYHDTTRGSLATRRRRLAPQPRYACYPPALARSVGYLFAAQACELIHPALSLRFGALKSPPTCCIGPPHPGQSKPMPTPQCPDGVRDTLLQLQHTCFSVCGISNLPSPAYASGYSTSLPVISNRPARLHFASSPPYRSNTLERNSSSGIGPGPMSR